MRAIFYLLMMLIYLSINSCGQEQDIDELIEIEVDKKIETFKEEKIENCWRYINNLAESYVDSILYLEIESSVSDSLNVPDRPGRPDDSSYYIIDLDTIGIDSSWLDSTFQQ